MSSKSIKKTKLFVGPVSINTVKSVIKAANTYDLNLGFVMSRRQIDYDGGYVSNWTTESFSKYVKSKSSNIIIERDHGGPGQGKREDDGKLSLSYDANHVDIIHIDPWKVHTLYNDAFVYTVNMIKLCNFINPNCCYEVGTEESICSMSPLELNKFLSDLKKTLDVKLFDKIIYVVIQSGTSLKNNLNTGIYNENRLDDMIKICNSYNKLTKEHNGDYLDPKQIKSKFNRGLNSINIAPEFGVLETSIILDEIKKHSMTLFDEIYKICYNSNKWKKWVDSTFQPTIEKEKLIKICGHYIFSSHAFKKIKDNFTNIDEIIQNKMIEKIRCLYE